MLLVTECQRAEFPCLVVLFPVLIHWLKVHSECSPQIEMQVKVRFVFVVVFLIEDVISFYRVTDT